MLKYFFLPLGNLIKQQIKDKGPIDVGHVHLQTTNRLSSVFFSFVCCKQKINEIIQTDFIHFLKK